MGKVKVNKTILVIFLSAFIITTSGYPLATVPGSLFYYYLIIPILFLGLRTLKNKSNESFKKINLYSIAYGAFVLITLFSFIANVNYSNITSTVRFLFVISFAYLFTFNIKFEVFVDYFQKIIKFIIIVSLVGFVYFNYFGYRSINLPTFTNVNDVEYYNGLIYFAIKSFNGYDVTGLYRNIGCFWEPGIFATFILIAIIFEILIKKNFSISNLFLFVIGLLTTNSTFAYLMLFPITIVFLNSKLNSRLIYPFTFLLILFSLVLIFNYDSVLDLLYGWNPIMFGKITEETASFTDRIEAPLINLKIFFDHPFFGAGLGNTEKIFSTLTQGAQTSTSTYFLAAFGISGILHLLFLSIGILKYNLLNVFSRIIILLIILIQINKEPHIYFSLTFIIMFYFLKEASLIKK